MVDAQMRSDMEALMTRLVQAWRALMDTRQQVAAAPKAAAPLEDTKTVGKAPTFTGEHKDCCSREMGMRRDRIRTEVWQDVG